MLTEAQVERSFRMLFQDGEFDSNVFEEAESLLDELRLESPLRHRLGQELDELRQLCEAKS